MTTINIGTDKGNITGAKVDKPFKKIEFIDITQIVRKHFGTMTGIFIHGWADVSHDKRYQSKEVKDG